MTQAVRWQKSSYSGGGDGNTCVEIAHLDTHIAVRDSKAPARATLDFAATAFTVFIETLKTTHTTKSDLTPR
ncbi:DUF397 domain-containing protein [Streptomyces puniciscabiei]|uniref:DUF397 domain-containing protein n=1 Tax=Streptomyces puniciscabiei TaxID=164348 RepID=UPI00332AA7F1